MHFRAINCGIFELFDGFESKQFSVRVRINALMLFSLFFDQLEVEFMEFSDEGYILHIRRIEAYEVEGEFCNTSVNSGDLGRRDIRAL